MTPSPPPAASLRLPENPGKLWGWATHLPHPPRRTALPGKATVSQGSLLASGWAAQPAWEGKLIKERPPHQGRGREGLLPL